MGHAPHAFFIPAAAGRAGQRLCLYHAAQRAEPRGALVYVHPFAEEMNKSRRMAALQSRAFARSGFAVLQIDLFGCGDSSGDFGDATWGDWVDDVIHAAHWLRQQHPLQPLWLWGLRAGCLLAAEAACQLDAPCNLLFWQPAPTGKVVLQQFLRLKVAGDMLDGSVKGAANTLRAQLVANETVEIAGYRLSPALATGLERATLAPPPLASTSGSCRAVLLEISAREGAIPSPVAATNAEAWRRAGYEVTTAFAVGPAFWQTSEIEEVPAMIDATLAAVAETADA